MKVKVEEVRSNKHHKILRFDVKNTISPEDPSEAESLEKQPSETPRSVCDLGGVIAIISHDKIKVGKVIPLNP